VVDCGYGVPVCECRQTAEECEFDLEVDKIHSFTRYRLYKKVEKVLPFGEFKELSSSLTILWESLYQYVKAELALSSQ